MQRTILKKTPFFWGFPAWRSLKMMWEGSRITWFLHVFARQPRCKLLGMVGGLKGWEIDSSARREGRTNRTWERKKIKATNLGELQDGLFCHRFLRFVLVVIFLIWREVSFTFCVFFFRNLFSNSTNGWSSFWSDCEAFKQWACRLTPPSSGLGEIRNLSRPIYKAFSTWEVENCVKSCHPKPHFWPPGTEARMTMSADHDCFQNSAASAWKRWNLVRSRDAACHAIACRASLPTKTLPTNQHLLPAVKVLGCQIWSASQRLVVSWETQAGRGGCGSSGVDVVGARCDGHLSEPALSPNVFLLFVQVTDWNVPIIFWVHIASALGRGFTFVSVP